MAPTLSSLRASAETPASTAEPGLAWTSASRAPDGVGEDLLKTVPPEPLDDGPGAGGDTVPGDASSTSTLALGGSLTGYVNTAGDKDWYRIDLSAGDWCQFSLKGSGTGALGDPVLEIRDASGALLASDDDGGPGLNSLLDFNATETGTYFVSAGGYGNTRGQYRLAAKEAAAPDPLDSIDWGTVVGTHAVKVYFAPSGEAYDGQTSRGWNDYEVQQAMLAFQQYSNVIDVSFERTADASQADLELVTNRAGGYLGYFNPPGTTNEGVGVFSQTGDGWDEAGGGGLEQGGYGFITMIHEFGHGMGLAHPHDDGGTSTVMLGVTGAFDSYGLYDLNQGVYTTMSYNDAWQLSPDGLSDSLSYGWEGTMMALDVAILQQKYGANTTFHAGNDSYALFGANAPGAMYACIWDAGGADSMIYRGAADAVLDLRAATIDYSPTGGGAISHVAGIIGGYTIAQGVLIENASGGSGDDRLTGNDAANRIAGGGGEDVIMGGDGADRLRGGNGADTFLYGSLETTRDLIRDLTDADIINLELIDANAALDGDQRFRLVDSFTSHAGQAVIAFDADRGRTLLQLDVDGDGRADMRVSIAGDHGDFVHFVL
jgi:hypothetical protein